MFQFVAKNELKLASALIILLFINKKTNVMDILSLIQSQLSGETLEMLSQQIGGNSAQTQAAIQMALPVLLQAIGKNTASKDGVMSFASALDKDHDGSILDDLVGFITSGNDTNGGSGILKHLFGQKRKAVEGAISQNSGLSSTATANLMTQLAPIVMGLLGKQKQQGGLDISNIATLVMNQFSGAKQKGGSPLLVHAIS